MPVGELDPGADPSLAAGADDQPRVLTIRITQDAVHLIRNVAGPGRAGRWRGQIGPMRELFSARVVHMDLGNLVAQIELVGLPD